MSGRFWKCGLLAALTVGLVGCSKGEKTYPVKGKVTYSDGTPLKKATVSFKNAASGAMASGQSDETGAFSLSTLEPDDGAPAGTYSVSVQPDNYTHKQTVEAKFTKPETSGISVTVKEEDNLAIDIKVAPGKK